ncbi:MAG TPA: GYF domain-containing protein [Polyangiaceae bacterium]|nr:GYF domain-containing protein [Polyangiaceae bacterium]
MTSLRPYMDWEANGPSYLNDVEVEDEGTNAAEEEIWHVAVSWDDIKTMTVDQLDDAFRLDVIAADTPVWKEGMDGWQPLSVVAGMEDGDDEEERADETDVVEDEDDEATVMRPFPFPAPQRSAGPRAPNPPPRPPARAQNPPPRSVVRVPSAPPAPSRGPSPQPVTLRNASARNAGPSRPAPQAPVKTQPRMKAAQPSPAAHVFAQPARSAPPPAAHVFAQPARSAPPPATDVFAAPPRTAPPPALSAFAPPPRASAYAPAQSFPPSYAPAQSFPPSHPPQQPYPAQPFATSRPAPNPTSLPPNADLGFARSMAPARPFARPRRRRSSGALYFFIPLALFGGLFAAYRTDLLRDAARALHQERSYVQLERALVGIPGFGTPRSVAASGLNVDKASDSAADSTSEPSRDDTAHRTSLDTRSAPSTDDHSTTPSTVAPKDDSKAEEPKAVEAPKQFTPTRSAPTRDEPRAAAPERSTPRPAPAHVAVTPPVSHATPTRSAPPPPSEPPRAVASSTKHENHDVKAAKVFLSESNDDAPAPRASKRAAATSATTKAAASFGSLAAHSEDEDEAPAPKAKPAPKPAPAPKAKPAAAPPPPPATVSSGNSSLDDAIRSAVNKHTPAKKKAPGADSDPLNGSLD